MYICIFCSILIFTNTFVIAWRGTPSLHSTLPNHPPPPGPPPPGPPPPLLAKLKEVLTNEILQRCRQSQIWRSVLIIVAACGTQVT